MIQLDNTIKGKEMLTPEQIAAHDDQIKQLPTIISLQSTSELLVKGQEEIQDHLTEVDDRLEDGKQVMNSMQLSIKSLYTMISDHVTTTHNNHKEAMGAISSAITEIKDNKIKDVVQDNKQQKEEFNKYKERVWSMIKIVFTGVVSLAVGGLGVYFFGK